MNKQGYHKLVNGKKVFHTQEEADALDKKWAAEEARVAEERRLYGYIEDRQAKLPKKGDQFDAIWKHLLYCRDTLNQPLHPECNAMLEKILAVKAEFPKPTE